MPYNANVFRILIASPSDVQAERREITDAIMTWNSLASLTSRVILLPVLWEQAVLPEQGDRPQAIVNKRIVDDCDALIGVFWTRLGTPTGVHDSGTAEEISRMQATSKRIALYFSNAPQRPNLIDTEQTNKLHAFKKKMRSTGIVNDFESPEEFARKIRDLIYSLGRDLAGESPRHFLDIGMPQYQGQVLQAVSQNQIGWGPITAIGMGPGTPDKSV